MQRAGPGPGPGPGLGPGKGSRSGSGSQHAAMRCNSQSLLVAIGLFNQSSTITVKASSEAPEASPTPPLHTHTHHHPHAGVLASGTVKTKQSNGGKTQSCVLRDQHSCLAAVCFITHSSGCVCVSVEEGLLCTTFTPSLWSLTTQVLYSR